jgi:pyruvate dehydrogenase E1 component beta subunit
MVEVCEKAARVAEERRGWSSEILDLRTLVPFDAPALLASVEKTGRLVVVHEAPRTAGFGGEIVATVAEKAIDVLEAPILRVTGFDTPFPYTLEHLYMPDARRVVAAIKKVMEY